MNLWQIWSLVEYISNKDFSGNVITPQRFNELIKVVNMDLFRTKYGLPEEFQLGRPVATEYADITLKNTDDLRAFKVYQTSVAVVNGILPFASNYAHRDTVTYNYIKTIAGVATALPRPVEILREAEFSARQGNWTKKPTLQNPIGVVRSNGIHIRPLTILAVDFSYYRFPVDPEFGYTEGDGFITYNAGTSTEFEWVKDEHLTLTRMILQYIGVNLREADLVQYSEQKLKTG
jgi:hypothetical protein